MDEIGDTATLAGRFSPRTGVRHGDSVTVAVNVDRINIIDPDSRLAIWD